MKASTERFTGTPFGLTNAPATFQLVVDMVLAGLTWKSCLAYLDDIIIFYLSFEARSSRASPGWCIGTVVPGGTITEIGKVSFL
jgi:hypothetical protein